MAWFHCKNCAKRHLGCHDTCEQYQEEKQLHDNVVEKERLRMQHEPVITERNTYYEH